MINGYYYMDQESLYSAYINPDYLETALSSALTQSKSNTGVFYSKELGIRVEGTDFHSKEEFIQACINSVKSTKNDYQTVLKQSKEAKDNLRKVINTFDEYSWDTNQLYDVMFSLDIKITELEKENDSK